MHAIHLLVLLRDGSRHTASVLAATTADAICMAIDTWGDALRMATARPHRRSSP